MKAQGTSFSNGQPKDLEGFVDQEIRKAAISNMARDFGWDEDITNAVVRGEWARQDQKKADHNTRKEATRSTLITAVTTVTTLGAAGALGAAMQGAMTSFGNAVGSVVGATGMAAKTAAQVGAQAIKTAVQVVDGSRNGAQGMLAGLANGVLGTMTAAKFDFGEMISPSLAGAGLGLGISYDRNQGWGGMLGVGGNTTNLSVSFSERGATTISGSYGVTDNINLTTSYNTGSGVTNVGATYNFDKGSDYENLRLNAGYSFHTKAHDSNPFFPSERERTGISGNVTYTTPLQGVEKEPWNPSMTLGFNPNGLNSSLSTDGVNLGTVTNNGYQAGSQNWVQENISTARNNAGSAGDQWLKGVIGDPGTFFRENIPIAGGVLGSVADMVSGTLIAGSALLPPYNISVSLSPNGELNFGFPNVASIEKGADRFLNGITTIPSIPGGMVNDLNGISGSMLSIGNSIRENPFIKQHMPFLGNLIASPIDMATGLFKMGTEIGTMPLQMILNPGEITTQGFPLPGFGDGLGTFTTGAFGMLGAANHTLTNVRAIGTEVVGSIFDTGVATVSGAYHLGLTGVNLGWETLVAPYQMGANLWNGKQLTEGLYDYTSDSWKDFSNDLNGLANGVSRIYDTGKALVGGVVNLGLTGVNLGWETLVAPYQMGANLRNGKPLTEGLYEYSSKTWNNFSKEFDSLVDGLSRLGNAWDIVTGAPAVDPNVFPKDKAAVMSRLVYGDLSPERKKELMEKEGIEEAGVLLEKLMDRLHGDERKFMQNDETGFKSMLYKHTTPDGKAVYTLAFAGTEDGTDWGANLSAPFGLSSQHAQAINAYKILQEFVKDYDKGAEIVLTGHSLGGGLAASVAHHFNRPAITFNAAGTNFTTNGVQNALSANWGNIDSYSINTDPLTILQNTLGLGLGTGQSGRPHTISASNVNASVNGHSMENFLD